jgi:hypothetical protein
MLQAKSSLSRLVEAIEQGQESEIVMAVQLLRNEHEITSTNAERGSVARLTGVGGRESRRQAYMEVFTASCQASRRTSTVPKTCRSKFVHIPKLVPIDTAPIALSNRLMFSGQAAIIDHQYR